MNFKSSILSILLGLSSFYTHAQSISKTELLLTETTRWAQSVLDQQNESIRLEFMRIDDPSYRSFLAKRLAPEHQKELGQVALSAFYEPYGQRSGRKTPICFILYNPQFEHQLHEQFFNVSSNSAKMALFLVNHELAHCLEHFFPTQKAQTSLNSDEKSRWSETLADAFAISFTTVTLKEASIFTEIYTSRKSFGANSITHSHNTAATIKALLSDERLNLTGNSTSMRSIWKNLDRLRHDHFNAR